MFRVKSAKRDNVNAMLDLSQSFIIVTRLKYQRGINIDIKTIDLHSLVYANITAYFYFFVNIEGVWHLFIKSNNDENVQYNTPDTEIFKFKIIINYQLNYWHRFM